jgi:acetyl esterase/lipase
MNYNYDPELLPLLELLGDIEIELSDPVATRAMFSAMTEPMNAEVDRTGVAIEDRDFAGPDGRVPIRIYTPEGKQDTSPGLLHIHGGGFVIGDLESELGSCVALCRNLGITVVSVDYRLAPETPYPGGLEDCYAALQWMAQNAAELQVDQERIGLIGMSAGGGLSAATALLARDRGGPKVCFQYLGIPEVDDRLDTPSMLQFVDTPMWNRPAAIQSWDHYLGDKYQRGADDVPPYAAPARATDLEGLPPAYVSTMEFDPLRDEGVQYALKMMQAGVATELHAFPGTWHGSSMFASAQVHQRESAEMFAVLRRGLNLDNK